MMDRRCIAFPFEKAASRRHCTDREEISQERKIPQEEETRVMRGEPWAVLLRPDTYEHSNSAIDGRKLSSARSQIRDYDDAVRAYLEAV